MLLFGVFVETLFKIYGLLLVIQPALPFSPKFATIRQLAHPGLQDRNNSKSLPHSIEWRKNGLNNTSCIVDHTFVRAQKMKKTSGEDGKIS